MGVGVEVVYSLRMRSEKVPKSAILPEVNDPADDVIRPKMILFKNAQNHFLTQPND